MSSFGNPAAERKALERTYEDTCTIYRTVDITEGSITHKERVAVYENQPCALSQAALKTTNQTQAQNEIDYNAKLFIAPELEIEVGWEIEVSRYGRVFSFTGVGVPFVYATHQEILMRDRGRT